MSGTRPRELTLPILGGILVVTLSVVAAVLTPPDSRGLAPGSSFSQDPAGSGAAYLTLQALGYAMRRSFDPLASLAANPAASVLVLADPTELASEQDRRALRAFVATGGTVLVTGCEAVAFLSERVPTSGAMMAERAFSAKLPSPLSAGVPRIMMASDCPPAELGPLYLPLYGDEHEQVVRSARIGNGLAVWWAGNTPIANRSIDAAGHLELLLNVAGPRGRVIIWDEFYHGQRRSLWSYARPTPLPWLAAQAGLVALVAAAMYVRRRVPVRPRFEEARTSPLEFVETMAGLYERAASASQAIVIARLRLRRLLLDATGLAPAVTDARLAAAASARFRVDAEELKSALEAADGFGAGAVVTAQGALPIVRRLQTFAAALDHRGG